jgi:hypothetical protein
MTPIIISTIKLSAKQTNSLFFPIIVLILFENEERNEKFFFSKKFNTQTYRHAAIRTKGIDIITPNDFGTPPKHLD